MQLNLVVGTSFKQEVVCPKLIGILITLQPLLSGACWYESIFFWLICDLMKSPSLRFVMLFMFCCKPISKMETISLFVANPVYGVYYLKV